MQYTAHLRSHLIINCFRCPLCDIKQIMTSVYILSCFMPFLKYRNNEIGPLALFLFLYARKGIKQDTIYTLVIICILLVFFYHILKKINKMAVIEYTNSDQGIYCILFYALPSI